MYWAWLHRANLFALAVPKWHWVAFKVHSHSPQRSADSAVDYINADRYRNFSLSAEKCNCPLWNPQTTAPSVNEPLRFIPTRRNELYLPLLWLAVVSTEMRKFHLCRNVTANCILQHKTLLIASSLNELLNNSSQNVGVLWTFVSKVISNYHEKWTWGKQRPANSNYSTLK